MRANAEPAAPSPTIDAAGDARGAPPKAHLSVLDGWRGISILLVLCAHLLPLGPKAWRLNETAGPMGMAIFFTLSGFLITRLLLADTNVPNFLIRRVLRIVPLAWLAMAIAFPLMGESRDVYLPNFFFYANLPPIRLAESASHLWSLCVEMQFYLAVALIVLVAGRRGLFLLPVLCLAITVLRATQGAEVDIVTWKRVDEILAGATLALIYGRHLGAFTIALVSRSSTLAWLVLFAIASHPSTGFMNYLRPYFAAALVGSTLYAPNAFKAALLSSRFLKYMAAVSFALYVIHGILASTWLGNGEGWVKYAKRPLLFLATFALAHLSTFHYERRWIEWGKRLTRRRAAS